MLCGKTALTMIQENKTQPVVHFVQSIADYLSPSKESDQLVNWVQNVVTDFGLVSKIRIPSSGTYDNDIYICPIYLLVHLIPDLNNRNNELQEFVIHIYAWRNPDEVPRIYTQSNCDKNQILDIIDDVINSKFDENDIIQGIEFILPCEWIHLDVNEWKRNEDFEWGSGLINDYQVVVRLDRYHYQGRKLKSHFRDRWKKQWNRFMTINNNYDSKTTIFWMCDHKDYDARLLCNEYSHDENKTCLMQTFLPQTPVDFGLAILNAGIPVAVWCNKFGHQKKDHDIIKSNLFELVKDGNLIMLPERIKKICRKPDKKKRLQDHLTLLWDNPEKLPKNLQESHN
jgi:hypothetical protein